MFLIFLGWCISWGSERKKKAHLNGATEDYLKCVSSIKASRAGEQLGAVTTPGPKGQKEGAVTGTERQKWS